MKPNVQLARMIRDLEPGDETQLHRIATMLAAGECVPIMDTARLAHGIDPDAFDGMRATAQAVRVALVNNDRSGLIGCGYTVTN
jgi:hypothetical protein